jgi:F0F1-type ATP synthase assembly protein I
MKMFDPFAEYSVIDTIDTISDNNTSDCVICAKNDAFPGSNNNSNQLISISTADIDAVIVGIVLGIIIGYIFYEVL